MCSFDVIRRCITSLNLDHVQKIQDERIKVLAFLI